MIFARLPLDAATGAWLAHGLTVDGRRLKKGHVLTAAEVEWLRRNGTETVLAAQPEAGDVPEDTAAQRVAEASVGPGCRANAPFTGRCNLYADAAGIAMVDRATVDAMNAVHESVTIATVAPWASVEAGQMLATVKIIPFAAPAETVSKVESIAAGAIAVAPFEPHCVGVISTRLPETKPSVIAKATDVMAARLERVGSSLGDVVTVDHHEVALAAAIRSQHAAGNAPIVIFAASAITDRRDVIPAGIVAAGGTIRHYGMPVDPGNLMLIGELDGVPVIGAPGCARSPKPNGFDWVLNRFLAGLDVDATAVMGMGVGGLLMDTVQRGAPRDGKPGQKDSAQRMPRIAGIVLAAGQSRRMGVENKLLADVSGKPMLLHAIEAVEASAATPLIVVTGHEPDRISAALGGRQAILTHNPRFADGLSTSLATGIAAVPDDCDGALVCLGDMPRITTALLDRMIAAFNPVEGRAIVIPTRHGKRGNPVLFDHRFFAAIRDVAGDTGARHLIGQHEDLVAEVAVDDDSIFMDVDTPEALAMARS
ncbi:MAG: molybdopterin-binding/glycosyltransferase family 2 protein [Minwuia sp.]|nr:molybdopterin-binding/glycosyltransferase family 2 protein [Minwuia sp.]